MMSVVTGVVVVGDRRGRELGFPTANVELDMGCRLPGDGVYAGRFERADGSIYPCASSIGRRPAYYEEGVRLLEAHLLDFDDDLYGERVRVEVGTCVRKQQRFASSEALVQQMRSDVDAVRALMANRGAVAGALETDPSPSGP